MAKASPRPHARTSQRAYSARKPNSVTIAQPMPEAPTKAQLMTREAMAQIADAPKRLTKEQLRDMKPEKMQELVKFAVASAIAMQVPKKKPVA